MPAFLFEVRRVLKPGGVFLWCDFRTHKEMKNLFNLFSLAGFSQIKEEDIFRKLRLEVIMYIFIQENMKMVL